MKIEEKQIKNMKPKFNTNVNLDDAKKAIVEHKALLKRLQDA